MLNEAAAIPATPDPRRIHARIEEIYRSSTVIGEDGASYSVFPASVTRERGAFVRDLCQAEHATRSLEIGMAWGLSTLFILEALAENGAGPGAHVVIDPFQTSRWHGAARCSVRAAGADGMIEFHEERSELLLPRLISANRQFDFAFIDGNHRFDGAIVDLIFVDRLLKPGGLVVFDDVWFDPVYLVCCFAETNLGYSLVAGHPPRGSSERPASPAQRLDSGTQMSAYRKPAQEAERGVFHFVPFFDGFARREEKRLRETGMHALMSGDRTLARRAFLDALRIKPFTFKTYSRLLRTFLPTPLARALTRRNRRVGPVAGGV